MTNTFNVPGVEENCFFLKDMEGAKALRQRINECFEISALPSTTPEERKRLLTFVVVCHVTAAMYMRRPQLQLVCYTVLDIVQIGSASNLCRQSTLCL